MPLPARKGPGTTLFSTVSGLFFFAGLMYAAFRLGPRMLELARILADLCSWLASGFLCLMLVKLGYKLKRQFLSAATAYGLSFLTFAFGITRLADLLQLRSHSQDTDPKLAAWSAVLALLAAVISILLLPFLRRITDLKSTAESSQERFLVAAEANALPFCIVKDIRSPMRSIADFEIEFANTHTQQLLQLGPEYLAGRRLSSIFPRMRESGMLDRLKEVVLNKQPYTGEVKDTTPEGVHLSFCLRAVHMQDGLAITMQDLREERSRQRHLDELNRFSQSIIQDAPFSIIATNAVGTITAVNVATEQLTGYRRHELVGKHSIVIMHEPAELSSRAMQLSQSLGEPVIAGFETLTASLKRRKNNESEWTYVRSDGRRVSVHLAMTVLRGPEGEITGYLAVAFDISERKKLNDSISFLAHHDSLTKLPNRALLNERIREAIERAKALDQQVACFLVDIDHFKRINDSLGHWAGDQLLIEVSERLLSAVRKTDTVARAGGDEFIVLLPNSGSLEDANNCAERMLSKLQGPVKISGREVNISASIGFCIYPDWSGDAVSLLRNADVAMYAVKSAGRNAFKAFNGSMLQATSEKLELEADLRNAIKNNEMWVAYQPQVDCKSGEIVGVEALLRWQHPTRGLVSPVEFIPIAEESGLILPIGQWALRQACMETRMLQDKTNRRLTLAANLSPKQFGQKDLSEVVEKALQDAALPAECLEIEITESTLMISSSETLEGLSRLRARGVSIAIDDFGTGFSNFKYILDYKADRLKIDRSFTSQCPEDPIACSVVRSVIAMAHGLGMKVVAEGVETEEQMAFLLRKRCDEAQGFLLSRPIPLVDLISLVREWQPAALLARAGTAGYANLLATPAGERRALQKPM